MNLQTAKGAFWALVMLCAFAPEAAAEEFLAPSGSLGAGLSTAEGQQGRFYAESSIFAAGSEQAFPFIFGLGYKPIRPLELLVQLPIGVANYEVRPRQESGGVALGNLQLGASFLSGGPVFRFKAGVAIAYGPWTSINPQRDRYWVNLLSSVVRWEDRSLWEPRAVNLTTPMRLEVNPVSHFLLSLDASFGFYFPTDDIEATVDLNLAPGFAFVSEFVDVGARFLILYSPTGSTFLQYDRAQTALEPYLRLNLGQAFLSTRLTINLDNPLGFAFDSGNYWALHLGGGAAF